MAKIKKVAISVLLLLSVVMCLSFNVKSTKAETVKKDYVVNVNEEIVPQGIYTDLNFSLNGGNGQVWFSVKNKFTLFPSIVMVHVELYRSDTYRESYTEMTLVASNYIYDLDQGNTISAVYQTNGKQSYWKGRAYYKIDSASWNEKLSATILFNADGKAV